MLALICALSLGVTAPAKPSDNLVTLAKAWEQVRLFHPWLFEREVDWDDAWLKAAPVAEAAQTPEALRAAVSGMLATLKDPITRVVPATPPPALRPGPATEVKNGVPVLNFWSDAFSPQFENEATQVAVVKLVTGQPRIVVDLRGAEAQWMPLERLPADDFGPSKPAQVPGLRSVVHHGYVGPRASPYSTVFEERLGRIFPAKASTPRRWAFVIDPDTELSEFAAAMRAAGEAFIVSTGPSDERMIVGAMETQIADGLAVKVRASSSTVKGFAPDLVVPSGQSPIDAAVALVKSKRALAPLTGGAAPIQAHGRVDAPFPEPYPATRALRQLAAVRVWMAARRFWGYPHLAKENQDAVLSDFVTRLGDAKDPETYVKTVAELLTHVPDSHTTLIGPTYWKIIGEYAPVEVRVIEGQFVITRTLSEAEKAGARRGDVVVEIDGQPVAAREAALAKLLAASNPESLRAKIAIYLLNGDPTVPAKLKVKGADGVLRAFELPRGPNWIDRLEEITGPHWKVLDGNIGYINLVALESTEIDAAMEAMAKTRALIFDDRGYPKGTAFTIAPMLDVKHARLVAQFYEPVVRAGADVTKTYFEQRLESTSRPVYAQPTAMLIDDQAISQSEHSGLLFEATAGTTFIGSPTLGANGDITSIHLPGGLRFVFSGTDVRHADGRQLQGLGLQPDVPVRPTIAGLRAGKDEVLDAALAHFKKRLTK